jgi:hypothetical protein
MGSSFSLHERSEEEREGRGGKRRIVSPISSQGVDTHDRQFRLFTSIMREVQIDHLLDNHVSCFDGLTSQDDLDNKKGKAYHDHVSEETRNIDS